MIEKIEILQHGERRYLSSHPCEEVRMTPTMKGQTVSPVASRVLSEFYL